VCFDAVTKIKEVPEIKNVTSYEERMRLLEDAHNINSSIVSGRNILLFDDLFRSGATMNSITQALYLHGKAANVYALAVTRTRRNF
jgi:predicted amidophosphoribosyltransferase